MAVQLLEKPLEPTRGIVRLDARQLRIQRRITLVLTVLPPLAVIAAIVSLVGDPGSRVPTSASCSASTCSPFSA